MNIKTEAKTILIAFKLGFRSCNSLHSIIESFARELYSYLHRWNAPALLRKEFPPVQTLELPSYHIEYAENGANFKWTNTNEKIKEPFREKIIQDWVENMR
jgi:hypothetical protein